LQGGGNAGSGERGEKVLGMSKKEKKTLLLFNLRQQQIRS